MYGRGNRDAGLLRQFYEEKRQALFTYALSQAGCPSEAEDIVHAVVAKLLQRSTLPDNLTAYAFRAIRNAPVDTHRRNGHAAAYQAIFRKEPLHTPEAGLREEAEHFLAQLGADERETVILKIYSGLSFGEIAEIRGVSINTAASWYRRALQKMRAVKGIIR